MALRPVRSFVRLASGSAPRRSFGSHAGGYKSSATPIALTAAAAGCASGLYFLNKKFQVFPKIQGIPTLNASAHPDDRAAARERTFIMIKPDGVARGLVGDIIRRFEKRGYKLVAMKLKIPSRELLTELYAELNTCPFFPDLIKHVSSGPVVAMVWEGKNAVAQGRAMLGETDPLASKPGTIRGDFSMGFIHSSGKNIIHGSDSIQAARREIALMFTEKEILEWSLPTYNAVYE